MPGSNVLPMLTRSLHRKVPIRYLPFLMIALFCAAPRVVEAQTLKVIRLTAGDTLELQQNAKAAFEQGNTIVLLDGGGRQEASRLLGVDLPAVHPVSKKDSRPITSATVGKREAAKAVAAYIDGSKTLHSLQVFAADGAPDKVWREGTDDWIAKQQALADGAVTDSPAPPAQAWTTLLETTFYSVDDAADGESTNLSIYRLNTLDAANDYYMVYMTPEALPNYDGTCTGIGVCGSHTLSRHFQLSLDNAQLYEHDPPNEINVTNVGFNFGASVGIDGPGVSTGFSVSWDQPDVSTTDSSDTYTGIWQEQFVDDWFVHCDPPEGKLTATSYGPFSSSQLAIFKVPAGTTNLQFPIQDQATFCNSTDPGGVIQYYYNYTQNDTVVPLGPPVLSASPVNLTFPAGGSQPLLITALIPYSSQGFSWKLSSNQSWLTVPSDGPYSSTQVIPVSIAPGTPDGSQGTISLDSSEPDATRGVVQGPIEVNVTVGTSTATNKAGVLLTGGENTTGSLGSSSFYNFALKAFEPTGQLQVPRYSHTATTLQNGNVVVIGGATSFPREYQFAAVTGLAEVYHPASLSFSPSGTMLVPRWQHTATLLPDGKVLVTGGGDGNGNSVTQAELYDPASGSFTAAGTSMAFTDSSSAIVLTQPGVPAEVLVFGGSSSNQTQIWSEASRSFSAGPEMVTMQNSFPAPVLNGSGDDVIAGGVDSSGPTARVQVFSPASRSFQSADSLERQRVGLTLTRLSSGALLAAGGALNSMPTAELEAGGASSWQLLSGGSGCPGGSGCMQDFRRYHTATLLPDGTVFLAGGSNADNVPVPTTEIFTPATGQFTAGPIDSPQAFHTANFISSSMTTLSVSPSPASAGQRVTLVANVNGGTGTVTFYDGDTAIGSAPIQSGGAVLTTSTLSIGSHTLTAAYLGSGIDAGSTSLPFTEVITDDQTTVLVASSANPSNPGQTVILTATVKSSTPVTGGSITFKDGSTTLATAAVNAGSANYSTDAFTVGTHPITAVYSGDASHGSAPSAVLEQVVAAESSTTTLSATPPNISFGSPVQLTAKVAGDAPLTGSVTFVAKVAGGSAATIGTVPLTSGAASLSFSTLAVGQDSLTASYSGDSAHSASSSETVTVTVNRATPAVQVTSSLNPSVAGQSVTFFAKVTGGTVAPTGTVQFYDGNTPLGAAMTLQSGSASVTPPPLSVGTHTIYVSFAPGDGNYNSAGSPGLVQTVNGSTTTTTLASSPNPSAVGQSVSFVLSVTSSQGTPSGTVRILDSGALLATVTLANGLAPYATTALPLGTHSISAVYAGDPAHAGSTSSALAQVVQAAATTTSLSVAGDPTVGDTMTFTASVTGNSPAGTVQFSNGASVLGTGQLANGKASFATSTLAAGIYSITAAYLGQGNNAASTSSSLRVVVAPLAAVTVRLTSSLDPSTVGQQVTFTVTVQSASGVPVGSVTLFDGTAPMEAAQPLVQGATAFLTSFLGAGSHTIRASYKSAGNFSSSTSSPLTQTVESAP
jgi:hypothetical protein